MDEANQPPSSMEVYINEQRADLQVLQMTVQILLMQMLGNTDPNAAVLMLNNMEDLMLHGLAAPAPPDSEAQRMQQMTTMRAQDFFQRMRKGLGFPARPTGGVGPAN